MGYVTIEAKKIKNMKNTNLKMFTPSKPVIVGDEVTSPSSISDQSTNGHSATPEPPNTPTQSPIVADEVTSPPPKSEASTNGQPATAEGFPIENQKSKIENSSDDSYAGELLNSHSILALNEAEPWPQPVDGQALLNSIADTLRRFVILPKWAAETLALWAVHTYAFQLGDTTTYIGIESPDKRCGKTTLLSVLSEP